MGESEGRERRHIRTFWVTRSQLILPCLLSLGFIAVGILVVVIMFAVHGHISKLQENFQIDSQTAYALTTGIFVYLRVAVTLCAFFAASGFVIGAVLSHRVYGPMVPIMAHLRRLQAGEYSSRAKIRDGDEFQDLVAALNQLAESLEKKKA